jgi:ubiquinol-cytochrome c reductase cytochrome b subunit
MKNYSLFIIGIIMLVFAGMFHIYRHGASIVRAPPPKPTISPTAAKPMPSAPKAVPPVPKPTTTEPLTAPPVQKAASGAQVATKTSRTAATNTTTTPPPTGASASSNSKTGDTTNVLAERSSTSEVRKK